MIQRKNYFIKKDYQFSFSVKFIALLALEAVLIAVFFMCVSRDTLTTGYTDSILRIENTSRFFFVPMTLIILIAAVGIGIAGMVVFIMLSHRIAGPLYRFEKTLESISSGDLTGRISLRKADQLKDLKVSLNDLVASLDNRMTKTQKLLSELTALLAVKDEPGVAAKIARQVDLLNEEIGRFKVSSR